MKIPHTTRAGVLLALGTATISGVSVFVNAQAVKVADPVVYTTLKNAIAAVILLGLAAAFGARWPRAGAWRSWSGLVALGIVGGSVPFILFFTGLAEVSAGVGALLHKMLFVWVALFAVVFLHERLGGLHLAAIGVLLVSQLLIQPLGVGPGLAEGMIALATLLWAIEVIVAKRVLGGVSSHVGAASRMAIGLVVLVGYVAVTGGLGTLVSAPAEVWLWAVVTGGLLAGYVATWYAALARAPASVVAAILTLGAPVTGIINLLAVGSLPTAGPIVGWGLVFGAVALIAYTTTRQRPQVAAA